MSRSPLALVVAVLLTGCGAAGATRTTTTTTTRTVAAKAVLTATAATSATSTVPTAQHYPTATYCEDGAINGHENVGHVQCKTVTCPPNSLTYAFICYTGSAAARAAMATHYCAALRDFSYVALVTARSVSCPDAVRIIRAFWSGPRTIHNPQGPMNATFWTLPDWPGWDCAMGAGGAACTNPAARDGFAGYDLKTP